MSKLNENLTSPAEKKIPAGTLLLLVLALLMMFVGHKNGEYKSYFQKAIMVCTQCIGLG